MLDADLGPPRERCSRTRARPGAARRARRRSSGTDPPLSANGSSGYSGWWSYVHKDLRSLLGRTVPGAFETRFCGFGDVAACAASLWAALDEAAAALESGAGRRLDRVAGGRERGADPLRTGDPPAHDARLEQAHLPAGDHVLDPPIGWDAWRGDRRNSSPQARRPSRRRCCAHSPSPSSTTARPTSQRSSPLAQERLAAGLPDGRRGARLHVLGHGCVRVGDRQPPLAG